jgi:phage-related protein
MPTSFSILNAIEKNQLASGNAFLVLLEIQLVDSTTNQIVDTVYVVNNNEDVVYKLQTYTAFPFDVQLSKDANGIPEVTLNATDYQKTLLTQLNALQGATGSIVIMRVVNSGNLSADPEMEEWFDVVGSNANDFKISIKLGAENPLQRRFPAMLQMRDRCRWHYKSAECGYTGPITSCSLTLQGANGCSVHNNSIRYGGFPGLKGRGIRYG